MTHEELLAKYTSSTIGANGLLNTAQARRFIDMSVEQSQLVKMVDRRFVDEKSGELYKIDFTEPATVAASEGTEYTDETGAPTHSKFSYTVVKRRTQFELTWEDLKWTIEEGTYRKTVVDMWNRRWAVDTELLAILGDEDLYGAPATPLEKLVDINEGWLEQISVAGGAHIIDATNLTNQYVTSDMFAAAYNVLPYRYLVFARPNLSWFMSPHTAADYRHYLMSRQTGLGDAVLQGSKALTPEGLPIVEIAAWPETLGGGSKTCIILMDPKMLIWIAHREFKLMDRYVQEGDFWRFTGYCYDDFVVSNNDAICKIINVEHNDTWDIAEES